MQDRISELNIFPEGEHDLSPQINTQDSEIERHSTRNYILTQVLGIPLIIFPPFIGLAAADNIDPENLSAQCVGFIGGLVIGKLIDDNIVQRTFPWR